VANKRQPDFMKTLPANGITAIINADNGVVGFVHAEKNRYERARREIEVMWLEAWALYMGSPRAVSYQRSQVLSTVGDVNADWRHRINTGKAYESVETIHAYLMSATFPNRDFFNMEPTQPGYADLSKVVKKYMTEKMYESHFKGHYEDFLRQLIITGNSCIALPWRYETIPYKKNVKVRKPIIDITGMEMGTTWEWGVEEEVRTVLNRPDFEVLDVFDCFIEPNAKDVNQGGFIRRMVKSRAEVIGLMQSGVYSKDYADSVDICNVEAFSQSGNNIKTLTSFNGINTRIEYNMDDIVELIEYWGDVILDDGTTYHDVVVTLCGDALLVFEPNPYWGGKPFVWGTYTNIRQAYGMGAITPNAGLLHELNIITNQRLDNQELSIDSMWTVKQDGIIQPEDVRSEPGKVYSVLDHTDIQPLAASQLEWKVTYQEVSVLETIIDKNFATGAMIGAGQGRSGERVTATEIQAVRDAGGNRLSNIHRHIEDSSLYPILLGVFNMMRQFVKEPEVIRVSGDAAGEYRYYQIDPSIAFAYDYKLKPVGADYVTDQAKYLQQRLDFIQAVSQVPQMAQQLNWGNLLHDIVHHMGFDDPDSYINNDVPAQPPVAATDPNKQPDPQQPQQAPPTGGSGNLDPNSPEGLQAADNAVQDKLHSIGGKPLLSAYQAMKGSGQLPQMMQQLASPTGQPQQPPTQQ